MRRLYLYITFLMYFVLNAKAQTPFDLFAPDVSRPMLQLEPETLTDTVSGKTISNLQKEQIKDDIRKWLSVDPLADKYPNISPYAYCGWNPINAIDPDGTSVNVVNNYDGTYTTFSGTIDNDLGVYVVDQSGERTGEIISQTLTPYTFFDNKNQFVKDAIINMNDESGQDFINHVINDYPNPIIYAFQALPYGDNDYKNNGYVYGMDITKHHYRAMPINAFDGNSTKIATARDIGNYAAGFIAGSNGLTWDKTRAMFNRVQGNLITSQQEPMVSTEAQFMGFIHGYNVIGKFYK